MSGLAAGNLVAERYRLERRLGAGGGGTVWRCADEKIGTTVAIKFVTPDGDLERWRHLAPLHGADVHARRIAGWTTDGKLVFVAGAPGRERIVRAAPGQALEPWPGTLGDQTNDPNVDSAIRIRSVTKLCL